MAIPNSSQPDLAPDRTPGRTPAEPAQPASRAEAQAGGPFALALLLAALAGWVDAAGVSGAGALFVSFMSGDTTQGAIAAAQLDWFRVVQVASVIGCFVTGVAAGELLDRPFGRFGPTVVLLAEAACLALGAWLPERVPGMIPWTDLWFLAFAMGLQNATMHRAGGINVGLTYITGTLVQFGRAVAALLLGGGDWRRAGCFAGLWISLAAGACASAVMLPVSRYDTLLAAAATSALLAAICALPSVCPR